MNVYTSDAVEFFTLVLTSGLIAVAALAVASLIGFTVAFAPFRGRAAAPARARVVGPTVEVRPAVPAARGYAAEAPAAVAG